MPFHCSMPSFVDGVAGPMRCTNNHDEPIQFACCISVHASYVLITVVGFQLKEMAPMDPQPPPEIYRAGLLVLGHKLKQTDTQTHPNLFYWRMRRAIVVVAALVCELAAIKTACFVEHLIAKLMQTCRLHDCHACTVFGICEYRTKRDSCVCRATRTQRHSPHLTPLLPPNKLQETGKRLLGVSAAVSARNLC